MAQKFALVDMEYILKNIPAYERASEQLNQVSKKMAGRGGRIDGRGAKPYIRNYQSEAVFLSTEQKTKKEEEIVAKEKRGGRN